MAACSNGALRCTIGVLPSGRESNFPMLSERGFKIFGMENE
jgi:hypothetical protein